MTPTTLPWRDSRSLKQVLASSRAWFKTKHIIEAGGGYSENEIAAVDRRLARPLPSEIREFYRTVRPVPIFSEDGPSEFGFFTRRKSDGSASTRLLPEIGPPHKSYHSVRRYMGIPSFGFQDTRGSMMGVLGLTITNLGTVIWSMPSSRDRSAS
jgi:hypothetical protein